jgi:hypothetical protein
MAYTMILWLLDPPQPERRMLATGIFKKISCLVLHVTYGRSCVQNSYHPSLQNLIVPIQYIIHKAMSTFVNEDPQLNKNL